MARSFAPDTTANAASVKRTTIKTSLVYCLSAVMLLASGCPIQDPNYTEEAAVGKPVDELPSWTNGPLKQANIAYVTKVRDPTSKDFIPLTERIATFDNDGTLLAEKPPMQELFAQYQVAAMVKANPALAKKQPFKAVLEHDKNYFIKGGEKAFAQLVIATHTGMKEEDFERSTEQFFATATYPRGNVPVKQVIYQPQVELMNYLRDNGFKVFICTDGTIEFVRTVSLSLYGVPRDQVIGSAFKYKYDALSNAIIREPGVLYFTDKTMKPAMIQEYIGQRPVFVCGNEGGGGDIAMLRFSQGSKRRSFQLLVNHDDSAREFFYQEKDSASLHAAARYGWHVLSMKRDWTRVFPEK